MNPLDREPIHVPARNRGYIAYPWRREPRWTECLADYDSFAAYRPVPPEPVVFDPTAVFSPIAPALAIVHMRRLPALAWGRAVVRVYLADEDQEARVDLSLFMLATRLITRIATVVHGEGWLER